MIRLDLFRALCCVSVVLVWIKAYYWMRLFDSTSFYVRLIRETIHDIGNFMILFVFILLTFANVLLVLSEGRSEPLYQNYFGDKFKLINAVVNQYKVSLGEFDMDGFGEDGDDALPWILFMTTTFITSITFLNMLVAIMGDTFARVSEVKD